MYQKEIKQISGMIKIMNLKKKKKKPLPDRDEACPPRYLQPTRQAIHEMR
jgi:hypothetical protein